MSKTNPTERLFQHPEVSPRTRIMVMGLGGAGSNSVANMSMSWSEGPPVVALNTDAQHLAGCEAPRVMQIGPETTRSMGANGDTNLGKLAMEESLDQVQDLLQDVDILFLSVGLGGGTGGGGAPVLLKAAHQLNIMTICFAAMPFAFESDSRKLQAEECLKNIARCADAVVVMPNDCLIDLIDPNTGIQEAFRKSDEQVAATIHSVWHLLNFRGVLNLDFAELRNLVEASNGKCHFGFGEASGAARIATAVRELMNSPYLGKGRVLSEAVSLLINITGGPDLTMADVQSIMTQIKSIVKQTAKLHFGAMIDPAMRNRIALTAIAADYQLRKKTNETDEVSKAAREKNREARDGSPPAQSELEFPPTDSGRFRNTTPTTYRGQDIDIPTYIRLGYKLTFER